VTAADPRAARDAGLTMIEVIVALFILALLMAAAVAVFTRSELSAAATLTEAQLAGVADRQLESVRDAVKTQGFDALALSAAPGHSSAPPLLSGASAQIQSDPDYFVSAGSGCGSANAGFDIEENWDNSVAGPPTGQLAWSGCTDGGNLVAEPLEVLSGGFLAAGSRSTPCPSSSATLDAVCYVPVGADGPQVIVHTYVTDTYVGCLRNGSSQGACPTVTNGVVSGCTWPADTTASTTCADARRVIVAVVPPLAANGKVALGHATPLYESTIFTAPTPANAPGGSAGLTLGLQLG
jgi:prepilin-type N-terminal cleavage/methylation domain-containing protein